MKTLFSKHTLLNFAVAAPLCPSSVTSNDYATFMERVIAKKLKEEAREARKQAKMKAALMESMKKK